jgi:hypothetical protein
MVLLTGSKKQSTIPSNSSLPLLGLGNGDLYSWDSGVTYDTHYFKNHCLPECRRDDPKCAGVIFDKHRSIIGQRALEYRCLYFIGNVTKTFSQDPSHVCTYAKSSIGGDCQRTIYLPEKRGQGENCLSGLVCNGPMTHYDYARWRYLWWERLKRVRKIIMQGNLFGKWSGPTSGVYNCFHVR